MPVFETSPLADPSLLKFEQLEPHPAAMPRMPRQRMDDQVAHGQKDALQQHPPSAESNADEDLLIHLDGCQQRQLPAAASLFCWQAEPLMLLPDPSQALSSVESCPGTAGEDVLLL